MIIIQVVLGAVTGIVISSTSHELVHCSTCVNGTGLLSPNWVCRIVVVACGWYASDVVFVRIFLVSMRGCVIVGNGATTGLNAEATTTITNSLNLSRVLYDLISLAYDVIMSVE